MAASSLSMGEPSGKDSGKSTVVYRVKSLHNDRVSNANAAVRSVEQSDEYLGQENRRKMEEMCRRHCCFLGERGERKFVRGQKV